MALGHVCFGDLLNEPRIDLPRQEHPFLGSWHIYSMEMWDEDHFNEGTQAFIQVRPENLGSFQFGLVSGGLDGYVEGSERNQRFVFTWEGSDEMDPAHGGGWLQLKGENQLDFQRNAREYVERLRETGRPEVLTVHGQAALVVQHADAYQKLPDLAAHATAIVGIQRGLQGMYQGTGEDAEDAFASLERELGIAEPA